MKKNKFEKVLTIRSLIIGSILSLFISVSGPYANSFIKGSELMLTTLPLIATVLLFFLILFVNTSLNKLKKELSQGELLIIFIMMFVACAIPTMGFTQQLLPILAGGKYYATENNQWEKLILSHIPDWLAINDPEAALYFFEGLPKGKTIPWSVWRLPLIAWISFILALYAVMYSMMVIIRKQWMEKEKIMYPLMQLPLEMTGKPQKGSLINEFFKNPLLWLGFAVPFLISSINGLHEYIHIIPKINLITFLPIFRKTISLRFCVSFPVIGISYFLTTGLSLSLWLFAILGIFQTGIFRMLGYSIGPRDAYCSSSPSVSHQGFGAILVLSIFIIWMARSHLKDVFRKAFKGDKNIDDSNEVLSYRTSVFIIIFGLIYIMSWLIKSGLPFFATGILLFSAFAIFIVLTKVIIQGGVMVVKSPLTPQVFTIATVGSNSLGLSGLASLAYSFVWCADLKVFLMPYIAHSFKLIETIKMNKKLITFVIFLAVLISMAGSICTVMKLSYKYGGINLNQWYYRGCSTVPFTYIADKIKHPTGFSPQRWMFTGIGAVVMAGLIFMRNNFLWWPIHPLGFPVGNTLPIYTVWFSIFIAWLIKTFVLKYGGRKIYSRTKYFFLGLVLGQFVVAGLWLIIDLFTGMQGNVLYSF